MTTDKLLKIEKIGKVWRALYTGPNGAVTLCSCATKRATEQNAEYLMSHMHPEVWKALVSRPNVQ